MSGNSVTNSGDDAEHEQQLESVIADFIRACDVGEVPNRQAILERHPDLADELRDFFAQRDRMNQFAGPIRGFGDDLFQTVGPGKHISYVGDYELLEEVARGGMGVVYKAQQKALGRIVAVKMMLTGKLANEADVQRFQIEAQAAASLQHPNIVPIHEVGQHEGLHYFSMDFVEGRSLSAVLRENVLPAKQAASYVRQMAEAIHYAHQQGTLHRDLKPSNVLIDSRDQVRITDFGLAMRVEGDSGLTQTGQIVGTPSYMPPEQAQGKRSLIGPASDVYSLGAILYECLTGRPPFRADSVVETIQQVTNVEAPSPRLLNPAVPRDLETICLKCLEKELPRRYETAQLLADDLKHFLLGEPISARPISRPARSWRWCKRNPLVAGLSAATIVLLVGTAAVTTLGYFRESKLRDAADLASGKMEQSLRELKEEQSLSSQLRYDVSALETRRLELNTSLELGETKLGQGEEKLLETYLQLARAAWRSDNIELADYYLNQCPDHLRKRAWHDLKHRCYPNVITFAGQRCVALSDDGKLLATVAEKSVQVWDVATQRLLHTLQPDVTSVNAIDISPDGKLLAIGGGSRVTLWNLAEGTLWRTLEGHEFEVADVEFSPDGKELASAKGAGATNTEVYLWNLESGQRTLSLPGLRHVVFSFDGRFLATNRRKFINKQWHEELEIWDRSAEVGQIQTPWLVVAGATARCRPAFHPLRNELAASHGRAIGFWDVESKQMVSRSTVGLAVECLAYSSDGKRLAYAGQQPGYDYRPYAFQTVIWNLITRENERTLPWYSSGVTKIAFSFDGRRLATAEAQGIKLWDVTPPPDPTAAILNDIVELKVGQFDWPQWGGSRARINTPSGKNIPITWTVGEGHLIQDRGDNGHFRSNPNWKNGEPPNDSKNIKWAVALGSESYGNPVVANGKVFLGTNNGHGYLKRYPSKVDLGVLLCFEEATGKFLWQHSNEKLPTGRVHDWPNQGVCSTPVVDGDRLWYVSNRGEVVCLDTEGFLDGEDDGVVQSEAVVLFRVNALLHGQLGYFDLPAPMRAGFVEAGLTLPKQVSVTSEKNSQSWVIQEYRLNAQNQRLPDGPPLFRVQVAGDKLRVTDASANDPPDDVKELFFVNDHLLADLGTEKVVFALRERLAEFGIQLLADIAPVTEEPGKVWAFSGVMNGVEQRFQVKSEGTVLAIYKRIAVSDKDEADVVWKFNMMKELGVSQHNMANCSMLTVDGMLFVCTSNGVDEGHFNIPQPEAPSFFAMDRDTGKVIWTDNSPGKNILHAQWCSPSYGVFDGSRQVIFGGGDGWLYSFDPHGDGKGGSKLLWKFDGNPKTSRYFLTGRSTRNHIIAFPAIYDGLVYLVMGEDPEHGEGVGHLWCIDPTKRIDGSDVSAELAVDQAGQVIPHRRLQAVDLAKGEKALPNPKSAVVWHYSYQDQDGDGTIKFEEQFHRSMSIPVIKDDVLYVADFSGLFHCLNAKTGKVYWTYDQLAACWGSALLVDGKVYICDEDGDVTVFRHSADPRIAMKPVKNKDGRTEFVPINAGWDSDELSVCNMGTAVYMTPIVANNVLYIATRNNLYAIQEMPERETPKSDMPDAAKPQNLKSIPVETPSEPTSK